MMKVFQVMLAIAASPASASRVRQNDLMDLGTNGLQAFKSWASDNCPDCDSIFGSLIEGVIEAGFMKESSCSWDQNTLHAKLNPDRLYGEIASQSRVPIMWTLDKTLSFAFSKEGGKMVVTTNGLGTQPPQQGLELYKQVMKEAKLNAADCVDNEGCIQKEIEAAGKYLKSHWKKGMKKDDRKVSKVLQTMKGNFAINSAIKIKGEYPKIMYSIISASPSKITSFVFEAGHVYSTLVPTASGDYVKFNLKPKSDKMGLKSLLDAGSTIEMATKFAKSGMNIAMMMAYGHNDAYRAALHAINVHGAEPEAVANMFAFCKDSTPGQDPECKGSTPGRVAWSSQVPVSMM